MFGKFSLIIIVSTDSYKCRDHLNTTAASMCWVCRVFVQGARSSLLPPPPHQSAVGVIPRRFISAVGERCNSPSCRGGSDFTGSAGNNGGKQVMAGVWPQTKEIISQRICRCQGVMIYSILSRALHCTARRYLLFLFGGGSLFSSKLRRFRRKTVSFHQLRLYCSKIYCTGNIFFYLQYYRGKLGTLNVKLLKNIFNTI